jgi:hypothetical protein
MKVQSNSDYLREDTVKEAIAASNHVASLAKQFDDAHLAAERAPTHEKKRFKGLRKKALQDAVGNLSIAA